MAEAKLQKLRRHIADHTRVLLCGDIGLSSTRVEISELAAGSVLHDREGIPCDRYHLLIPFCGTKLRWTVIYHSQRPDQPPDFVFNERDVDFMPDISTIKSLADWKSDNPDSLLNVVKELIQLYRQHQEERLIDYPQLEAQASMLRSTGNFPMFDVIVNSPMIANRDVPMATFLVPLPIDFSGLPSYLSLRNSGSNKACILVSFFPPENDPRVHVEFALTSDLHRTLSFSSSVRLPRWGHDCLSTLSDYIPAIHQVLLDKVEKICDSFLRRRECVLALCSLFGKALLEYDSQSFFSATFLLATPPFHFLFIIRLNSEFPQQLPVLIMQSIYHETPNQQPFTMTHHEFPYSPRWSGVEFAERTRIFLCDKAKEFKERCLVDKSLTIIS